MPKKSSYLEHFLNTVERKRAHPPTEEQLARLLAQMRSPDETVRAKAVRRLCPCRAPWPIYQEYLAEIHKLQKDPNPQVRHAALHLAEDADSLVRKEERHQRAQERQGDIREELRRERCPRRRELRP